MTTTTKLSSSTALIHPCLSSRVEKENCNNSTMKYVASPRRSTVSTNRGGIRGRRHLKSALYFALTILCTYCSILPTIHAFATTRVNRRSGLYERKSEWVERSVQYYSTVMRKAPSSSQTSQLPHNKIDSTTDSDNDIVTQDEDFVRLATKHYYARHLIKRGSWEQAEKLYRRIINELSSEDDGHCDHSKLAVSTLLLSLHMQRVGDTKGTRAVFLNFFRRVAMDEDDDEIECSCSAKVLQAYALFEMKNGHERKSLEIIKKAVQMDNELSPVLGWKQFRDVQEGRKYQPTVSFNRAYSPLDRKIQNKHHKESCVTSPKDDAKYVPIRRREIFSAGSGQ